MADFQSRLIGSWTLASYHATSISDPADIVYPLGQTCRGRAIFSHDGYISAYIQSSDIEAYPDDRGFHASKEQLADAASKTLAYTGKYRLEEGHGPDRATVYYDVELSLPPNWIGKTEVRELELRSEVVNGEMVEELILRPPGIVEIAGKKRKVEVVTVRAAKIKVGDRLKLEEGERNARL